MIYEFTLYRPGVLGFDKKSGEPLAFPPEVEEFEANSHTEARNLAIQKFKAASVLLTGQGHFSVGLK